MISTTLIVNRINIFTCANRFAFPKFWQANRWGRFIVCYFELRKMKEHLLDPWHHGDKLHPDIHDWWISWASGLIHSYSYAFYVTQFLSLLALARDALFAHIRVRRDEGVRHEVVQEVVLLAAAETGASYQLVHHPLQQQTCKQCLAMFDDV